MQEKIHGTKGELVIGMEGKSEEMIGVGSLKNPNYHHISYS